MKTEKEQIKELVDAGVYCLKIENKNGEEVESVYLLDNYTAFSKVNTSIKKNKNISYLDLFVNLLKR